MKMHRELTTARAALAALALAALAPAAPAGAEQVLTAEAVVSHDKVPAGEAAMLAVVVKLAGAWHVNAAEPADEMLIPTRLTVDPAPGLEFDEPRYPEPESRSFKFAPDEELLVYEKQFTVRVPFTVAADAAVGSREVSAKLRYQACDDERCLPPRNEPVRVTVAVAAAGTAATLQHAEVFPSLHGEAEAGADEEAGVETAEYWEKMFTDHAFLAYGAVFLVGLGLNLTPCVYPIIPITLGFFTNQSEQRGGKTFSLAVTYVLGMAMMYSALGVFAALAGKMFGTALQSPITMVVEAAIMLALALSMFGLYDIQPPSALTAKLGASPSGHLGAVFMGLTVGVVAAPCLAPAVGGVFLFVAKTQSVVLGFSIFFGLALGLGFPFLILGTLTGGMSTLPRAGEWMIWVKHLFGFLLLGMALYFLRPLTGNGFFLWGIAVLAVVAGVFLGWVDKTGSGQVTFARIKAVAGVALVIAAGAVVMTANGGASAETSAIAWQKYDAGAFERAHGDKPILVDFTAEWCIPCKELDKFTFSDERVVDEAQRYAAFKADGTYENEAVEELGDRYGVSGFPTVLFIDSKGEEQEDLRVVGFVDAEDFLARLEKVR